MCSSRHILYAACDDESGLVLIVQHKGRDSPRSFKPKMGLLQTHRSNPKFKALLLLSSITLATAESCALSSEGNCRAAGETTAEICASGEWQALPIGSYECVDGEMRIAAEVYAGSSSKTLSFKSQSSTSSGITTQTQVPAASYQSLTGNALCTGTEQHERHDKSGSATYAIDGKMASVYFASQDSPFRCDIAPPDDGYYVAFWTQYNGQPEASQPPPINCNETITLRNPKLNRVATAKVIDRCASCVGVGHQTGDSTTADCLVNGATIDLSKKLWNYLYDKASPSVYDIEYSGDPYLGWREQPALLTSLTPSECNC